MKLPPALANLIANSLPVDITAPHSEYAEQSQDEAYRDALESLSLALYCDGVPEEVLLRGITTALDAYGNHNG
jgi:hypothetical protein